MVRAGNDFQGQIELIGTTPVFPLQESLVVMNQERDRLHILNPTGRAVYEALAAGLAINDIVSALAGVHNTHEQIQEEINDFLRCWGRNSQVDEHDQKKATEIKLDSSKHGTLPTGFSPQAEAVFRLNDLRFRIRCDDKETWNAIMALYAHLASKDNSSTVETVFSLTRNSKALQR